MAQSQEQIKIPSTTSLVTVAREPSERLQESIRSCAKGFRHLRDNINETIEIGLAEGFTTKEVSNLIRQELAKNAEISDRQIRRYLPSELKDKSKMRSNLGTHMTANTAQLPSQVKPEDYQSDQLTKYPKLFLIEIIKYLESQKKQIRKQALDHPKTRNIIRKLPSEITKQVLALHSEGKSSREISRLAGISKTSVLRILSK